jgi:hypothetical protein
MPVRAARYAFILRVWIETADLDPHAAPVVRGSLQRADTGQTHYFGALDDLPASLRGLLGWAEAPHPGAETDAG